MVELVAESLELIDVGMDVKLVEGAFRPDILLLEFVDDELFVFMVSVFEYVVFVSVILLGLVSLDRPKFSVEIFYEC